MEHTVEPQSIEPHDQALRLAQEVEATSLCATRLKDLLPGCVEILALLNSGTFISSSGHIKLHKELSRHASAYSVIVEMTGNTLVHHPAGFYHLQAREGQGINLRERQIAGAIFCLVEWLSDRGLPVESMINSEEPVSLTDIGSLVDHHRERLAELGLGTLDEFMANGVKKLCEAGVMYTQMNSKNELSYCLGIPTYFYLDIAKKLAKTLVTEQDPADHVPDEAA